MQGPGPCRSESCVQSSQKLHGAWLPSALHVARCPRLLVGQAFV